MTTKKRVTENELLNIVAGGGTDPFLPPPPSMFTYELPTAELSSGD